MKKILLLVALMGLIIILTSCQKSEEIVLTKYFQAMQLNDKDTLTAMSTDPKDIEFVSYKIVKIYEPEVKDAALPTMVDNLEQLKKAKNEQLNLVKDKIDELEEAKADLADTYSARKKRELKKKVEELQAIVDQETAKYKELVTKTSDLKKQIEYEKQLVKLSTSMEKGAEYLKGKVHDVRVDIKIKTKEGEEKDYVFLLRKYLYKNPKTKRNLPHRYVICKIQTLKEFNNSTGPEENEAAEPVEEVKEEKTETQSDAEQKK